MGKIWSALGIIVGILSLASIVQRMGQVELVEYASVVLEYYRSVSDPAKWLLFDWWAPLLGWNVWMHRIGMDLIAIWSLAAASSIRMDRVTELVANSDPKIDNDDEEETIRDHIVYVFEIIILAPYGYLKSIWFAIRMIVTAASYYLEVVTERDRESLMAQVNEISPGVWESYSELRRSYATSIIDMVYLLIVLLITPLFVAAFFVWNAIAL